MMRCSWLVLPALIVVVSIPAANAQDNTPEQWYGAGVHALHAGRLQESLDLLTQVVKLGTHDPRVYYFRGLAHMGMGNSAAGLEDFRTGAQFEVASQGRFYPVNRALERIQGPIRLELEQVRQAAIKYAVAQQLEPGRTSVLKSIPVIPDAVDPSASRGQPNFPDVSGIDVPGTPFSQSPAAPEPAEPKAEAAPAEKSPPAKKTGPEDDPFDGRP